MVNRYITLYREKWSIVNCPLSIILLFFLLTAFSKPPPASDDFPFDHLHSPWVDSVFNSLTFEQRIGQLLMVAAYSNKDQKHVDRISDYISQYHIGGLVFFQGGPLRQAQLTNHYQNISQTPLLIAMDAEWGLGMRLDSCIAFPRQMPLGAIQDVDLIYKMGQETGIQLKRMGVHLNFAPVVDINNQPANPVIGIRSFGENSAEVSRRSSLYMKGLQEKRILTAAKHFPGHGNTTEDSHQALPVITDTYEALNNLEWEPYKRLMLQGLTGVLAGHLSVPSLDSAKNLASSLSRRVMCDILRDSLHFQGLIYTDALNMRGVAKFFPSGEVEVKALAAGADVLLMPNDVPRAIAAIKAAVDSGRISDKQIELSCRRILAAKQWCGLTNCQPVKTAGLQAFVNRPEANLLNRQLVAASLTVVQNINHILPLTHLDSAKTAVLITGQSLPSHFLMSIKKYEELDYYFLDEKTTAVQEKQLAETLSACTRVIVGIHNTKYHVDRYSGIAPRVFSFVDRLSEKTDVVLCLFAPPYALSNFENRDKMKGIVVAYQDSPLAQDYTAQLLYGGIGAKGSLPVSVDSIHQRLSGITTAGGLRLRYSIPEEAGIASRRLLSIDTMVVNAIDSGVMPGCQILAARNGIVFFQREYGNTRYDRAEPVRAEHIYDLASVTKVSAALPAVMLLLDNDEIKLRDHLEKHLPFPEKSEAGRITLMDLLTHQAKMPAFIPFYMNVMQATDTAETLISRTKDNQHPIRLSAHSWLNNRRKYKDGYFTASADSLHHFKAAEGLFVMDSYRDTIFKRIKQTPLLPKKQYLYSDLGFILLTELVEQKSGVGLDEFAARNFYRRLGATTLGYRPLERFPTGRVIPTANDTIFRNQWLQGYVHDENASLMGGVSGHAGLYSNAGDLAKLMQMYLNKGVYGGERFLEERTMEEFTECPFCRQGNRRGIGFDKPEPDPHKPSPAAKSASPESFGHSGFTGTCVWMDPNSGLLFIFLSNRVCPDAGNNKLVTSNLRTRIYQTLTEAITSKENCQSQESLTANYLSE
ncbi:MAG: serine hydrolase [Bacteroidales bacterium]|jgi:beta-glucosidase-like glycosyl hydrolase/CubicO group peptidase (beta-lactamase class C family)|nr:serine hydrolase [Bacteroidales bacterium]